MCQGYGYNIITKQHLYSANLCGRFLDDGSEASLLVNRLLYSVRILEHVRKYISFKAFGNSPLYYK